MSNMVVEPSEVAIFPIKNARSSLQKLEVTFSPIQAGEGDPSPDNIRPITGISAFDMYVGLSRDEDDANTYHVSIPATPGVVYGGTLDLVSGTLVVTESVVDISVPNWAYYTGQSRPVFRLSPTSRKYGSGVKSISSKYKFSLSTTLANLVSKTENFGFGFQNSNGFVIFRDDQYNDNTLYPTAEDKVAAFKAANVGQTYTYELATPATYQLTPVQIEALVGTNYAWTDAGLTGVEYLNGDEAIIKLNNVDVTDYFTPTGVKVSYKKVEGSNGGVFLSGDIEDDVLAWKAVVTLTCMPLTDAQQSDLLQKIMFSSPTLCYLDPMTNDYRTITYSPSLNETVYRGAGGTGVEYWTGLVLTAEEKAELRILRQPEGLTDYVNGQRLNLYFIVAGDGWSYQWYYHTASSSTWKKSTSASGTTSHYYTTLSNTHNGYHYKCIATHVTGITFESNVVSVTRS